MNETDYKDHSHCPLCHGIVFKEYKLGLLQCHLCDLVIAPTIWQEQANERMEEEWFGESYEKRKSSFWVEWIQVQNNRVTLSRLSGQSANTRMLEIGVGSGSLLKAAKDKGYDVMGCDLSPPICQQVERTIGVPVHCGPLESLSGENRFDIVVMNHVLEHVNNPVEFLQNVLRLLAPGGIVHIAVPNIACWESSFDGWTSYEPYHLAYFDRCTLIRAISSAGFSLDSVFTKESFSGWFLALLRTALGVNREYGAVKRPSSSVQKVGSIRQVSLVEHGYRIASLFTGGVTLPLRWFQGQLGYGDEIICIAHKRRVG